MYILHLHLWNWISEWFMWHIVQSHLYLDIGSRKDYLWFDLSFSLTLVVSSLFYFVNVAWSVTYGPCLKPPITLRVHTDFAKVYYLLRSIRNIAEYTECKKYSCSFTILWENFPAIDCMRTTGQSLCDITHRFCKEWFWSLFFLVNQGALLQIRGMSRPGSWLVQPPVLLQTYVNMSDMF